MSGAWVRRARLQAADGAPMPTKHTSVFRSAREAAMVIISAEVWVWVWVIVVASMPREPRTLLGEGFRPLLEHIGFHPGQEAVAVARDRVPFLVIGVIALVVTLGIGRMGAARHADDGVDGPGRQDHGIEVAWAEVVDDLLDRDDRALGGKHRLLLHPDDASS